MRNHIKCARQDKVSRAFCKREFRIILIIIMIFQQQARGIAMYQLHLITIHLNRLTNSSQPTTWEEEEQSATVHLITTQTRMWEVSLSSSRTNSNHTLSNIMTTTMPQQAIFMTTTKITAFYLELLQRLLITTIMGSTHTIMLPRHLSKTILMR
jgi:hypothetical protein